MNATNKNNNEKRPSNGIIWVLQSRDICLLFHYNYKWSVSSKSVQIESDQVNKSIELLCTNSYSKVKWICLPNGHKSRLYLNPEISILFIIPREIFMVPENLFQLCAFGFGGEAHKNFDFFLPQMVRADHSVYCAQIKKKCAFVHFCISSVFFLSKWAVYSFAPRINFQAS